MRTTLSIDDDVLAAARGRAEREHRTVGEVVSELARRGMVADRGAAPRTRNGIPLLARDLEGPSVTRETVNQLRDDDSAS